MQKSRRRQLSATMLVVVRCEQLFNYKYITAQTQLQKMHTLHSQENSKIGATRCQI